MPFADDLKIMSDLAGRCPCGWCLPISVFPYERGAIEKAGNCMPRTFVSLCCPHCGHPHRFYSSVDDMPPETAARFKKERA